jgi:hypothetical protein
MVISLKKENDSPFAEGKRRESHNTAKVQKQYPQRLQQIVLEFTFTLRRQQFSLSPLG